MRKVITHYELCEITCKKYMKSLKADLGIWEYQSVACSEQPDVLIFKNTKTTLFEIKISRSDFLSDKKKECRIKYKLPIYQYNRMVLNKSVKYDMSFKDVRKYFIEQPHLGNKRYYVCPHGLIKIDEVPDNWGLIWFENEKFKMKKESKQHRKNIRLEMKLLTHAFRKKTGPDKCNVIVNSFISKEN